VTIRELKAKSRVILLSQLPVLQRAETQVELARLAALQSEAFTQPDKWHGDGVDTLCLFVEGKLLGGLVLQRLTLADPLVLDVYGVHTPLRAVLLELLVMHMQGILIGMGQSEFFFSTPLEGMADWKALLQRQGIAERLDSDRIQFFRRSIGPNH